MEKTKEQHEAELKAFIRKKIESMPGESYGVGEFSDIPKNLRSGASNV
jgi:hypothetical protein